MPAYITQPDTVLADHKVTTDELWDHVRTHHPEHPDLPLLQRVIARSGVQQRYFTRPLEQVAAPTGMEERNKAAFTAACAMATVASRRALAAHGLDPGDIDALITSHTTSWSVPQLDVHLVEELGLRPTVARIPITTQACAAGAQTLIRAVDYVRAHPGTRVLVVVAEALSTIHHHSDSRVEHVIYRALFGDSAGATLVTDTPLGAGFAAEDTMEFQLPASRDRYWARVDEEGFHFDSTRAASHAANDALPHLQNWLTSPQPEWAVIHPGGPRIITSVAEAAGLTPDHGRHATNSLAENGNLGGNAVLDVLRRTHTGPPAPGAPGALVAFGPGFIAAGLRGTWHAPAAE